MEMVVKMAASMVEHGEDAFRKLFRFYKRRNPPADLSQVIDFSKRVENERVGLQISDICNKVLFNECVVHVSLA